MAARKGKKPGTPVNTEVQLTNMLMTFRVSELQMLLGFAGLNKTGRKSELQNRAVDMIRGKGHQNPQIASKIRELYKSIQTGGTGVVQGSQMELSAHSSHAQHGMSAAMMPVSRSMGNPLPNFHPLAARNNMYVPNAANLYPTYPQAGKGPQSLPPAQMMQQAVPTHPDVTLKRIPFYEVEGELLRPSTLIQNPTSREPGATFHFYLSPSQADAVSFNREITMGKSEYLFQERPREIQMRFCVCETSCEQEDAFPPGLVAKVNGKACPLPAGPVPINKPAAEAKRPPRPVNISALCKLCPSVANTIHLNWTPDYNRGGTYIVGVWVVKRLSAMDLLDKLKTKGPRSAECTAGIIKEKLNDEDCDIATTSLRVSLICPLGKMKMVTPIRPVTCTHLQCFDATIFLQMNEKKPTWLCPVCNKPALYDNLVIDGYFMDVMSSSDLPSDCHEIQLNKDGSWSAHNPSAKKKATSDTPKANETIQEINDLDSDDDGPALPPPPAAPAPAKLETPAAPPTTTPGNTYASSNGSSGLRSSPSIIMLDSPSPPPRDPSPRVQPTAPPLQAPSPSDSRSPYLPQQTTSHSPGLLTQQPLVTAPPQSILQPSAVLPPHAYHPQVHQPQDHQRMQTPYTSYMPYDSRYHPF
uniref:E3 SUMO-protein ligase PIAS3 n=1 Tax=Lygus hesperus TaxID=30085 RepID=A0A146KV62_LYGHE